MTSISGMRAVRAPAALVAGGAAGYGAVEGLHRLQIHLQGYDTFAQIIPIAALGAFTASSAIPAGRLPSERQLAVLLGALGVAAGAVGFAATHSSNSTDRFVNEVEQEAFDAYAGKRRMVAASAGALLGGAVGVATTHGRTKVAGAALGAAPAALIGASAASLVVSGGEDRSFAPPPELSTPQALGERYVALWDRNDDQRVSAQELPGRQRGLFEQAGGTHERAVDARMIAAFATETDHDADGHLGDSEWKEFRSQLIA